MVNMAGLAEIIVKESYILFYLQYKSFQSYLKCLRVFDLKKQAMVVFPSWGIMRRIVSPTGKQ
jgi:hypothetical protein